MQNINLVGSTVYHDIILFPKAIDATGLGAPGPCLGKCYAGLLHGFVKQHITIHCLFMDFTGDMFRNLTVVA